MSGLIDDKALESEENSGNEFPEGNEPVGGDEEPANETRAAVSGVNNGLDNHSSENDDDDDFNEDEFDEEGDDIFIAGDDEEEENVENETEEKYEKKKQKRHRDLVLEEEDYELLEENTGIRRHRPGQHRRLKKAREVDGEIERFTGAKDLQADLFGPEDDEGLEDDIEVHLDDHLEDGSAGNKAPEKLAERKASPEDDDIFDEEDEDDWIVDEFEEAAAEEGGEEAAKEARRRRRRKQQAALRNLPGVDADALEEAHEIFGDVDEYLEWYESARRQRERAAAGEEEEEQEEEDEYAGEEVSDAEEGLEREEGRTIRKKKSKDSKLHLRMDPEAATRHFLLPADDVIRETDIPERLQLEASLMSSSKDAITSDSCVEWIWRHLLFETESKARAVLEDGVREVEGPPPSWMGIESWPEEALKGGLSDTKGARGLFLGRFGNDFEGWLSNESAQNELKKSIKSLLVHKYVDKEEIPYIAMYRKDELGELLCMRSSDEPENLEDSVPSGVMKAMNRRIRRWDILYTINRLAMKYATFVRRQTIREKIYTNVAAETAELDARSIAAISCRQAVQKTSSIEELEDIQAKFNAAMTLGDEGAKLDGSNVKPRKRRGNRLLRAAMDAGLYEALNSFSITAEEFGENVESGFKVHEPNDPLMEPSQFMEHYINPENPAVVDGMFVSKSIIRILSLSLSSEPAVRKAVREQFWAKATISTELKAAGVSVLNAFHPLGIAKRIKGKPVSSFKRSDTYMRLSAAEEEGYVNILVGLPNEDEDIEGILAPLQDLFVSGGLSEESQTWNELRKNALRLAVVNYIVPSIKSEIRRKLAADAMEVVLQDLSDSFWEYAVRAPIPLLDEEGEEVYDKRILAAVYGPGDRAGPPSTLVILDSHGSLVDFLHCPQLSGMIPKRRVVSGQTYSIFDDPKKSKDAHKIRDFIETHLPHAIIVGMGNPEAKSLKSDISLVLERILSDNPRAMSSLETGTVLQFSVDESIAVAWENSTAAEAEMPSAAPIVRRGVALAREAMDPFAVLASLCGQSRESLSLRLHPLQKYIPNEIKMKSMEDILCSAAAQIGLDLNLAASVPWRATYLPFIPGMGLRKASALLRAVVKGGGALEERDELLQKGLLSNCVFHNAAPYLRIRASSDATQGLGFHILDDTRIMPGDYAIAIDLAKAAVGDTGSNSNVIIEDAIEHPEKIETMDLVSFKQEMHQHETDEQGQSNEMESHASLGKLIDIQMELVSPFGDIRPRFNELTGEQIFWLLSGEDKSTLRKGRKVEARVRFVNDEQAICNIPELNGLEAVIESTAVSSKQDIVNCRDYFKQGDTVVAAVLSLDSTQGLITLSTASNHLNNDVAWEYEYFAQDDEYYSIPDKKTIMQEEAALRGTTGRSRFVSRPIRHPYFKNVSVAEAAAEVSAGPVGVALIRPATKSFRRLHITMCLPCGIIWHVDVKEMGQVAASLRLATPLEVQPMPGHKFEYEDLDELVVRFIDPVSSAMRALASHRKWNGGPLLGPPKSWEEVQDDLKILKSQAPNQAAYCLAADAQRPGAFYLGHLIGSNPRREYFVVVPDGFYFRKKVYGTVEHMLVQFKKNPKGNPPPPSNYDNTVTSYSGGYHQPQAYGYA